jgi:hypothetical protein
VRSEILRSDYESYHHLGNKLFCLVGFEVFTAVVLKSIIFWDMTPCSAELFYDPEDGGDTFLRNVGYHSTHYTAS